MGRQFSVNRKLSGATICYFLLVLVVGNQARNFSKLKNGAVVSNAPGCAEIGRDIMKKGGNIMDTVIATAFCEGVGNPTTMGIGGGFMATIYERSSKKVWSLISRETAPAGATEDMFAGNSSLSQRGGLSVAIPSELRGYIYLYQKWGGGVSWRELVEPTIKICESGIEMNPLTEKNVRATIDIVRADPGLKSIFINPETDDVYKTGEKYKRLKLAETLKIISKEPDAIHDGTLTKSFVKDIQDQGGIITEQDLKDYQPQVATPIHTKINGKNIYSIPSPGAGMIMTYVLNILDDYLERKDFVSVKNYQRIVESFKYGYAVRSKLGDRNFVEGMDELIEKITSKKFAKESRKKLRDDFTSNDAAYYDCLTAPVQDHGTANIVVWGPNGDGISFTSSINYVLGAGFVSPSTGIILNDSMDDFSAPGVVNEYGFPPSPPNYIEPGKRPQSSMCPTIILNGNNDLFMIVGGAGGSRITTSVTQVIMNRIYFNLDIKSASDQKRVHHQLLPMNLFLEDDWLTQDQDVALGLEKIGHNITYNPADGFTAVTTIALDESKKNIVGVHDKRRTGSVAYLHPPYST